MGFMLHAATGNSERRVFSAGTKIFVTKTLENTIWQCF
jgi:hypothetical protein